MEIFLDSCVLVGYANKDDTHYEKSKIIIQNIEDGKYSGAYISDYVFSEFLTVSTIRTKDKMKTVKYGRKYLNSKITLIKVGYKTFEDTWKLFQQDKNNKMSFVDYSNLAMMDLLGVKNIATFDSDFKEVKGIKVIDGGLK